MKKFLFFICAAFISFAANAQTSQIATLSHNGEITTFYSSNALIEAHTAAADGDIITLSAGSFAPTKITKAITLRGSGMMGNNLTVITGNFYVTTTGDVTIEGIYFNSYLYLENAVNFNLIKCRISRFYNTLSNNKPIVNIIQCDIFDTFYGSNAKSLSISNSYIAGAPDSASLENCILSFIATNYLSSCYLTNCIIINKSTSTSETLSTTAFARGCYHIGAQTNPFRYAGGDSNKVFPANTQIFKEGTTTYELLDELKTSWLGIDGTQVGIHGGNLPFDPETTTPKIKKFDVSSKTSADGKLSINLEIDAE